MGVAAHLPGALMFNSISVTGFLFVLRNRKGLTVVMAATYSFKCPNGHTFDAIAKLRARCPQCGITARRDFTETSVQTPQSTTSPSSHKVVRRKDTGSGSNLDLTSTKEDQSSSTVKKVVRSVSGKSKTSTSPTKKPVIVKQGLKQSMPKTVKKPIASKPPETRIRGPVKRVAAKSGHTPTVSRKPRKGTRERKVAIQTGENERFWLKVKRQYFG